MSPERETDRQTVWMESNRRKATHPWKLLLFSHSTNAAKRQIIIFICCVIKSNNFKYWEWMKIDGELKFCCNVFGVERLHKVAQRSAGQSHNSHTSMWADCLVYLNSTTKMPIIKLAQACGYLSVLFSSGVFWCMVSYYY